jgi:hypothetical protein
MYQLLFRAPLWTLMACFRTHEIFRVIDVQRNQAIKRKKKEYFITVKHEHDFAFQNEIVKDMDQ